MRIHFIAPSEFIQVFGPLDPQKYLVKSTEIVLDEYVYDLKIQNYALDFHSITVSLIDFNPDWIIVIPFVFSELNENSEFIIENTEALTTEFVEHICEVNKILNAKVIFIELKPNSHSNNINHEIRTAQAISSNYHRTNWLTLENLENNLEIILNKINFT